MTHYNIHDVIRVRSQQRLPELAYFQADKLSDVDIEVRVVRRPSAYRRAST